jgi:hypothetical protein
MAIPFLNHLDVSGNINLNDNKLNDFVVDHSTTSDAGAVTGKLIYDSGTLKYYDGSAWQSLGTSSGTMSSFTLTGDSGSNQTIEDGNTLDVAGGNGISTVVGATDTVTVNLDASITTVTSIKNASLVIGRDADNDIDFATDNTITVRVGGADQVQFKDGSIIPVTDDDIDLGSSSNQFKNAYFDGTVEVDTLTIGGVTSVPFEAADHTKLDGIATGAEVNVDTNITVSEGASTVEIQSSTGTNDSIAAATTSAAGVMTAADKTKLDGIEASADVTDTANVKTALNASFGGSATIGDSSDTFTIPGNLVVSGTQTVQNETIQVVENNTIQFEGTTADAYEVKLTAADATSSDKTITLPNLTGHVALLAAAATGTISATPAELNVLDGFAGVTADLTYAKDLRATGVTTTEFDKLDGLTASTSELNILDGVTSTTSELNILDGVTSTAAELNYLDGTTLGTVVASKAVAVDSNKDVTGFRNITLTGELDAATLDISGNADIDGTLEADAITVNGTALNTVIDNRIKVIQKTATVDVSSLVNNVDKCNINHGMTSNNIIVKLYDSSTMEDVFADVDRIDTDTIQIRFSDAPSNDIVVVMQEIIGDNIDAGSNITYPTS